MPEVYFKITSKPAFRDLLGRFSLANSELQSIRRSQIRHEAIRFKGLAQEEAPGGVGHTVAKEITYRTYTVGNTVAFEAFPGKIGAWHIAGTGIYGPRGQLIVGLRGQPLRFVKEGKVHYRMWVRGVKKNPFFSRAYRRWLPGARIALRRIAQEWVRVLSGEAVAVR